MSVLDMMLSQVVKKYHGMNIDAYNQTIEKNTELYSYELDCSAIQLLVVLCLLVGLFQIVMGKLHSVFCFSSFLKAFSSTLIFITYVIRHFPNGRNFHHSI